MPGDLTPVVTHALWSAEDFFAEGSAMRSNCRAAIARIPKLLTNDGSAFVDARTRAAVVKIIYEAMERAAEDGCDFLRDELADIASELQKALTAKTN